MAKSNRFGIPDEPPPPAAATPAAAHVPGVAAGGAVWEAVKKALFSSAVCYGNRPEYCVQAADFVDPILQEVLDQRFHGKAPQSEQEIADFAAAANAPYMRALQQPEGLARIEKLLEQRFHNPQVREEDSGLVVDLGVIPGKLTTFKQLVSGTTSEHLEDGQWKSSEIGTTFKTYLQSHPKIDSVRLLIGIPETKGQPAPWEYFYSRKKDIVVVISRTSVNGAYLSEPLGKNFDAVIGGERSLHTKALRYDRRWQMGN